MPQAGRSPRPRATSRSASAAATASATTVKAASSPARLPTTPNPSNRRPTAGSSPCCSRPQFRSSELTLDLKHSTDPRSNLAEPKQRDHATVPGDADHRGGAPSDLFTPGVWTRRTATPAWEPEPNRASGRSRRRCRRRLLAWCHSDASSHRESRRSPGRAPIANRPGIVLFHDAEQHTPRAIAAVTLPPRDMRGSHVGMSAGCSDVSSESGCLSITARGCWRRTSSGVGAGVDTPELLRRIGSKRRLTQTSA
jgi:hypothetical protein